MKGTHNQSNMIFKGLVLKKCFLNFFIHLSFFKLILKVIEVHVFVAQPLGPAEADPVDDGGVVELI